MTPNLAFRRSNFSFDFFDPTGSRVPFIVNWPARIKAGTANHNLVCLTDILPTLTALAGAKLPNWSAEDGIDQSAQLFDTQAAPSRV